MAGLVSEFPVYLIAILYNLKSDMTIHCCCLICTLFVLNITHMKVQLLQQIPVTINYRLHIKLVTDFQFFVVITYYENIAASVTY